MQEQLPRQYSIGSTMDQTLKRRKGRHLHSDTVIRHESSQSKWWGTAVGIPTVQDRILQQAVQQALTDKFDRGFSRHSYGHRAGHNRNRRC
jgi:hypothetical protein